MSVFVFEKIVLVVGGSYKVQKLRGENYYLVDLYPSSASFVDDCDTLNVFDGSRLHPQISLVGFL